MTQRWLSESERHAIAHAEWAVSHASPSKPDVCFDYELVQTLLGLIKSGRAAVGTVGETATEKIICNCEHGHDSPYWTCPKHGYVVVDT